MFALKLNNIKSFNPSMPCLSVELYSLSNPTNRIKGLALIDTGASISGVEEQDLQSLGLNSNGTMGLHVTGSSSIAQTPTYVCQIEVSGVTLLAPFILTVTGNPPNSLHNQGLVMLLGRDFLKDYRFVYDGKEETWILESK